ncbi:dTMP kinase [Deinococcus aquiradiocola]|uniref:dTMP kinase n=1 Tax=Deinococcus aquiradiocola TaxID=393059 RepID=UPI00166A192C|nr:dTMP kinase [Deinococcus aquiradiocola]
MSLFVTLEGPEGAGKSTQLRLLAARLEAAGVTPVLTREPGGTDIGTQLRALVLDTRSLMDPMTEFLIYSASRAQLVREVVRPTLASGGVVVCDRYVDSSYAYQGYGRGLDLRHLRAVSDAATGGLLPHLTVLLDLDPATGLTRAARVGTPDRIEAAGLVFHERVRAGFQALAQADPARFLTLDATRPEGEISDRIWAAVGPHLP